VHTHAHTRTCTQHAIHCPCLSLQEAGRAANRAGPAAPQNAGGGSSGSRIQYRYLPLAVAALAELLRRCVSMYVRVVCVYVCMCVCVCVCGVHLYFLRWS